MGLVRCLSFPDKTDGTLLKQDTDDPTCIGDILFAYAFLIRALKLGNGEMGFCFRLWCQPASQQFGRCRVSRGRAVHCIN
jgi:hypothetical protein